MQVQQLKKEYDLKIEQSRENVFGTNFKNRMNYRHAILNEITGPGLTKYLDTAGNILVLIDEFDGDHQKLGMFGIENKPNNGNSSAASVLKSFHTGMPYYQKGKVSDSGHLQNPQVSFLGASNGAPVLDILRAKIKSSVMPDAMVMRTTFEVFDSPPKFTSNYKSKLSLRDAIGLELLLLASSLVCNQTYVFDTEGSQSADDLLQAWQDNCVAAGARWKNIDKWISARFSKTSELTSRLAAQIAHINLTYDLLQEFIVENNLQDPNGTISFNTYCKMVDFFYAKYPPHSNNAITTSSSQVEAAMYSTQIILLKFFNLFDLSINRSIPIKEIPWIPSSSNSYSNPAVVELPATQTSTLSETQIDVSALDKCQMVLLYPSICFTFSQIIKAYPKLKHQYTTVEPLILKLINMQLLMKIENGLRSGRNSCNLYIKTLPESITLNTVNSFVKNNLDQIKMPWALYKANCEKVVLPSATATLSEEVRQILNQDNYRNTDSNTSCSVEHVPENIMGEKEGEPYNKNESAFTSHRVSRSNRSTSSIVTNTNQSQVSSSSSQMSINTLLPRPPRPILRNVNIDNNIDPVVMETELNRQNDGNDLLVSSKENESIDGYVAPPNEQTQADVRRSTRARRKNKRIYSPEPSEGTTNLISKKKSKQSNNKK
ncbi:unnamed protein product [Rotaria socialis]|uniref:Uncharacterized protein n=1 Tax=Rotaria socialis TaxID=392032 RepID=A0A818F343_9BILA|nr:unnamed protein product [Rotaria socialis]